MKILVMGAGAVGAYFGARLQAAGEQVIFCARGENLRALNERPLAIRSYKGDLEIKVNATDTPARFAPYDLILFCVKAYDTDAAAEQIKDCLAPGGAILTLQNGVENEYRLIQRFGEQAVLGGNAHIGAELSAPGRVLHQSTGTIVFGELDGAESERAKAIAAALERAGILGSLSNRIRELRWDKLTWNAAFNTVTTLTRRTVGEILDDPQGRALLVTLMEEVLSVARAEGAKLAEDRAQQYLRHSEINHRPLRTSTGQDAARGKPIEYEALSGAVLRAARRHGLPVPATETVYTLLKLLDGAPRGK